jgi:tripartite-type tricarboxylate transporter receptor subunit TctC
MLAAACDALQSRAADPVSAYPDRPIRLIMPNAPGSANDTMGRILAAKLGDALGQQIVVVAPGIAAAYWEWKSARTPIRTDTR